MDALELDEAAVLTPLKTPFKIHEEEEEEDGTIVKIPHGLTAKQNRRKSFHNENMVPSFNFTPQRAPLTAPRNNILNSQPVNGLEHTKRSLINELKSMRSGKENDTIASPAKEELVFPQSNPDRVNKKRRSTVFESSEQDEATHKVAKPNEEDYDDFILVENSAVLNATDDNQKDEWVNEIEVGSEVDDEELSRIEPFATEPSLIPTQEDEPEHTQFNLNIQPGNELTTPCRITEPIAISPKTEQHSRVVDESHLLLDTSKSPSLDDSFVAESPLSHNTSVNLEKHDHLNLLESLNEISNDDEVASLQERSSSVAPKERPFFTIRQVHDIQDEFKSEVEKLQESLKLKSSKILELSEQANETQIKILRLKDDVQALTLLKKQLMKENELLNAEHGIFKNDIEELRTNIKSNEGLISRQKHVIQKFKERVSQLDTENRSQSHRIEVLQEEIETKTRAIVLLQGRSSDYEDQAKKLFSQLQQEAAKSEGLLIKQTEYLKYQEELQSELVSCKSRIEELTSRISTFEAEALVKSNEIEDLTLKLQSRDDNLALTETEKTSLQQEINLLKERNDLLQNDLSSYNSLSLTKIEELHASLALLEKEGHLKNVVINSLQHGIETLQTTIIELKADVDSKKSSIHQLTENLSETSELLIIRKAEVDELGGEIEEAKQEMAKLHSLVKDKNHDIEQLSNINEDHSKTIQLKNDKINELDEELQKQEADHLNELETFHAEMSNLQDMVSTRSVELHKLKEDKETLTKENDLLKYELDAIKGESIDFDTRLTTLKTKLQESKSYCSSLEDHINQLKADKLALEADTDKRLQELAEDLYIQYSKKHEQKVQLLKKGYEQKWSNKYSKLENEQAKLKREIEGLQTQLENEKKEKNEIIKLWDQQREAAAQ